MESDGRTPLGVDLSKLAEEVEHFGRDVLFDRGLIDIAQRAADLGTLAALPLRSGFSAAFDCGWMVGFRPLLAILFTGRSQINTPRGRPRAVWSLSSRKGRRQLAARMQTPCSRSALGRPRAH